MEQDHLYPMLPLPRSSEVECGTCRKGGTYRRWINRPNHGRASYCRRQISRLKSHRNPFTSGPQGSIGQAGSRTTMMGRRDPVSVVLTTLRFPSSLLRFTDLSLLLCLSIKEYRFPNGILTKPFFNPCYFQESYINF